MRAPPGLDCRGVTGGSGHGVDGGRATAGSECDGEQAGEDGCPGPRVDVTVGPDGGGAPVGR